MGAKKLTLEQWIFRNALRRNWLGVLRIRKKRGKLFALVYGRGWFLPHWEEIPADVRVSKEELEAYMEGRNGF